MYIVSSFLMRVASIAGIGRFPPMLLLAGIVMATTRTLGGVICGATIAACGVGQHAPLVGIVYRGIAANHPDHLWARMRHSADKPRAAHATAVRNGFPGLGVSRLAGAAEYVECCHEVPSGAGCAGLILHHTSMTVKNYFG